MSVSSLPLYSDDCMSVFRFWENTVVPHRTHKKSVGKSKAFFKVRFFWARKYLNIVNRLFTASKETIS